MGVKIEQFIPIDPGADLVWRPQYEQQQFGKGDDPDDDEPDDDDDEPDDDDDEDDPYAGKTVEELVAELKATNASLSKASGSGKLKRDKIKRLQGELDAARAKPKPKAKDDDEPVDIEAIKAQAREEAKLEARRERIADKAEAALGRAGVNPDKLAKAVKLLDLEDIDLNDDGTLDGFDEQLDALKEEWAELFAKKRNRRQSVAGENDRGGDRERSRSNTKSASEQGADRILRRG